MEPGYWFTLAAQVINFLVLVWLLKHFLYGRIVKAMSEREAEIARRLEAAAQQRVAAEQEAELFRARNRELQEQRDQMVAQAREEAEVQRQKLLEAARRDAEAAQAQWFESLRREQQVLLQEVRERLGQQAFAIARRALKELAGAELEREIVRAFTERLATLDAAERGALVAAARDSDRAVEVRTAFPVPSEARENLSRSLRQQLDERIDVRFTTVPELMCGIELRAHSYRLVWNLDSYLEGLEDRVFGALDESAIRNAQLQ